MTEAEIVMDYDMMTRDDKKSKFLKLLKIVQKRLNMISKDILHYLAKFQISWPSFTVILGNFEKLEQDENFLEQDIRTVRRLVGCLVRGLLGSRHLVVKITDFTDLNPILSVFSDI